MERAGNYWQAKARQVARRVNLAWCLETLSAPMVVLAIIGAMALLLVRRELPDVARWTLGVAVICSLGILIGACAAWARKSFERPEQSLVRIEAAMRLQCALSAAQAGVAPWPAPIEKIDAGLSWQWPRIIVPQLGALVILAAGLLIPVPAKGTASLSGQEQPQVWKQLDAELDHLSEEQVVDEKYIEETRKKLEELESQAEEQWFSHPSLEATDSLKKAHRAEAARVARELGRVEKALAQLEEIAGSASVAEENRLLEELDQALQGLQTGAMKPNPALLEQLQQHDLHNLANLTPAQLAQLRESLQKNLKAMKRCESGSEGEDGLNGVFACEGEGGSSPGTGGVDCGPGHDPNVLGNEKQSLETGALTGLQAEDLSNATPGDLLELQESEHDVNLDPSQTAAGGDTRAIGKGGDRVWKDSLDPDEQRTLKRFFE